MTMERTTGYTSYEEQIHTGRMQVSAVHLTPRLSAAELAQRKEEAGVKLAQVFRRSS